MKIIISQSNDHLDIMFEDDGPSGLTKSSSKAALEGISPCELTKNGTPM